MGLLIVGERQAGSQRYRKFSEENISRIQMIRNAKAMGFTLLDVQKMIKQYDSGVLSEREAYDLLAEQLKLIRKKIAELKAIEQQLSSKIASMEMDSLETEEKD